MESDVSFSGGNNPTDQMFLLECQVKRVLISSPDLRLRLGSDDLVLCDNTRLAMTFMNYPEIELCEDGVEEKRPFDCAPTETSCGKSCLFALSENQLMPFMQQPVDPCSFSVQIRIYSLDSFCGDSLSYMLVGCCAIPMGELFSDMLNQSDDIMDAPVTCVTQQDFPFKDKTGMEVGTIFASVRVSCFGKMILAPISLGTSPKKEPINEIMTFDVDKTTEVSEGGVECPRGITSIYREEIRVGGYMSMGGESEFNDTTSPKAKYGSPNVSEAERSRGPTSPHGPPPDSPEPAGPGSFAEVPEPEFTYEEIRAVVNGHSLFFKVLKKGKRSSGDGRDVRPKLPAVEAPVRDRASLSTSMYPRKGDAEATFHQQRRPSQQETVRAARRSLKARSPEGNGGYRGSGGGLDWDRLNSVEDLTFNDNIPVDGPIATPPEDEVPVKESRSKEVFSISVGQQVMLDGEVRPKLLLEIRGPKTKEDFEEEEAAIDAVEDRHKRRVDRKKAMAMVSDGTQFLMSDIGDSEDSNGKRGNGGGNKAGKGSKKEKGKK